MLPHQSQPTAQASRMMMQVRLQMLLLCLPQPALLLLGCQYCCWLLPQELQQQQVQLLLQVLCCWLPPLAGLASHAQHMTEAEAAMP
jgi:hypothetical protein